MPNPENKKDIKRFLGMTNYLFKFGPPHMAKQKQDNQLEHTYSSYARIRDVALKTCHRR